MEFFSIKELCKSATADKLGITNTPTKEIEENLTKLIDYILDPLRRAWGKPIIVSSGYRCPKLNKAIGGVSSSQHQKGQAADITAGSKELNKKLFQLIQDLNLPYDQVIDESKFTWIHVSYSPRNRRQVLHL